jgi:predicted metal-dependent phosphoesterase TrpH/glycosyltransferase involved in cell wall biosynthesis
VTDEPLSIVQVCPRPWGSRHEINRFVDEVSTELARRGHRVAIAAPSESRTAIRDTRRALKAATGDVGLLLGDGGEPSVLAIGQSIPLPSGPRRRPPPIPVDVSRTLEQLLATDAIDIVHVHDPFAPSPGSAALRHSFSLNVASFHEPAERVLSTQVARTLVEMLFGRIDARTASYGVTGELLERFFPGPYESIGPGAATAAAYPAPREDGPLRIAYCAEEERGALRLLGRALRRLPRELDWEIVVWAEQPLDPKQRLGARLRNRVTVVRPGDASPEAVLAGAAVACFASGGVRTSPSLLQAALAAGAVPVASDLEVYRELAGDGERGLLFPAGDWQTLAAQLQRLLESTRLRDELRSQAAPARERTWSVVADEIEAVYRRLAARRHPATGDPAVRKRISGRELIHCDLHMHTDHSPDCATPVEVLLRTARERGLGAIAITDHNEISGALEARELAEEVGGIKIIVAEEVKTAHQGEVIGLFIEEKIERGMTMEETIAEIRRQGGLVYVPHPFDRLHSVPDYEHLLDIVEEIDFLEVFNPRVAISSFNEEAVRFARKYRIIPGAGSDSHVAQGLGSVMTRLRDFESADEFREAMRDAEIVRKTKNMVYVQTLKFLQTSGGRGGRSLDARDVAGRAAKRRRRGTAGKS